MKPPDLLGLAVYVLLLYFSLNTTNGNTNGDQCSRYATCLKCTGSHQNCSEQHCPDVKCGWDDEVEKCKAGTETGPTESKTQKWFFYNCKTSDSSTGCSNNITKTDCYANLCDQSALVGLDEYNKSVARFLCSKCKDFQNCFKKTTSSCHTWDETKCPNGSVATNLTEQQLAELTVFNTEVLHIDPNKTTLYACGGLGANHNTTLILTEGTGLDYHKNRVLISNQAGTISHVVNNSFEKYPWTFAFARKATLFDIIDVADFSYKVADPPLFEPLLTEFDTPNMTVIHQLRKASNPRYKVHDLTFLKKSLYRLAGSEFEDEHGVKERRTVLAVPKTDAERLTVSGLDVILAEDSVGYLERVSEVQQLNPPNQFIAKTKLMRVRENEPGLKKDELQNRAGREFACPGGDMRPGVAFYKFSTTSKPAWLVRDSVIVGRQSAQVALEVVHVSDSGDFTLYEGYPIQSVQGEGKSADFTTVFGPKDKVHQARKRRAKKRKTSIIDNTFKDEEHFKQDFPCADKIEDLCPVCSDVECGAHFSLKATVAVAVNIWLEKA